MSSFKEMMQSSASQQSRYQDRTEQQNDVLSSEYLTSPKRLSFNKDIEIVASGPIADPVREFGRDRTNEQTVKIYHDMG